MGHVETRKRRFLVELLLLEPLPVRVVGCLQPAVVCNVLAQRQLAAQVLRHEVVGGILQKHQEQ